MWNWFKSAHMNKGERASENPPSQCADESNNINVRETSDLIFIEVSFDNPSQILCVQTNF